MVSKTLVIATVFLVCAGASAQTNAFRAPDVRSDPAATKTATPAQATVTPEMRGDIYMARKMYREAVEAYKEGGGDRAVLINKTGIAYHQLMDLESARRYYERAIKVDPSYSEAINNLGTVYYAKKNFRRAVSQYRRALRHSPDSASIHSNLGTAYFARKDYEKAMEEYQTALKLDPEVFEHRGSAGVLLQDRSVEERAKFHYYQAKLYAKNGMTDRALLCLRKAIEEGLKDRDKIGEEPDFAIMKELPEFKEILAWQPRAL